MKPLLIASVTAVALVSGVFGLLQYRGNASVDRYAHELVAACSKEEDHATCYEREVPNLYPKVSLADIFSIIREVRSLDPSYQFCHVLAHKVGERVVAEDPERWLDAIPLNPSDGLCSNGFIHGVVGGRFRAEVLDDATLEKFIPEFARACEPREGWNPSTLDQAICYHGLGHLYDFITNANVPRALSVCTRTTTEAFRRVCVEGVFMQLYQPLEPDDYLMIEQMPVKPTKATVRQFCASFKDPTYVGACLRESWPFFRAEIFYHDGAGAFCSGQPDATQEDACYESVSSIVGRMSLGNPQGAAKICNGFPEARREICFSTSAEAVLEESRTDASRAVGLCELASPDITRSCINLLISRASFIFGSNTEERSRFCDAVPASEKDRCLATR